MWLAGVGLIPTPLGWLVLALYPLHAFWSLTVLRVGLTFESVSRLRSRYRRPYAVIGLAFVVALLLR